MRRLSGIVVQLTLLMVVVVVVAVFLLFRQMAASASRVVVDHEIVDLDEETQLLGWQVFNCLDSLRHDSLEIADVLARESRELPDPVDAGPLLMPDVLAEALPERLFERYLRVEVFPLREDAKVPEVLSTRCEQVSAAIDHFTDSRTEILKRVREHGEPLRSALSASFHREVKPFVLKDDALARLRRSQATSENPNPVVWPRVYNVLWAGVRVPTGWSAGDDDWIVLVCLGLDETFSEVVGSPRHLGFLYDQTGTLYLHPTHNAELATGGGFHRRFGQADEMFEHPLRDDFESAERNASPLEIGRKDTAVRRFKPGQEFYFCETADASLDDARLNAARRVLTELTHEYLEEEWGQRGAVPLRRLSGMQSGLPRIRMLATSRENLDRMLADVRERLRDDPIVKLSKPTALRWAFDPVRCQGCLASTVRIHLNSPPAADAGTDAADNRSIENLTLVRAAFDEELTADLESELAVLKWEAYAGGLLAVVVAIGLSLLITLPLKRITRAAQSIAQAVGSQGRIDKSLELDGYLDELPVRRPDEIGALARTFRGLVAQVQEYAVNIRRRESLLRGIHDTAMDGIMTIDESGRIRSFNPAAERIFGFASAEVIDRPFSMLYPRSVAAQLEKNLEHYLATGEARLLNRRTEVLGQRRDGRTFPLELSMSEVDEPSGRRLFASLLRDVTDRKQAERARDLLVANDEKTHALREIAHETIGDLTSILGAADQYRRRFADTMTEKQSELLARIERSARSLVEFVEDLRDIARISEGSAELQWGDVSPREVIEDVLGVLHAKIAEKHHRVETDLAGAPSMIRADKSRLRQVIKNLLSNACKYTPPGGKITIRARAVGDDASIEVSDTGIGIPEDERERVFTDFGRCSNADSQATGQGLGLALCRRIVEMHHGEIDFESRLGAGTTFRVRLPLRAAHRAHKEQHANGVVAADTSAQGFRVLLADTNSRRASELADMLRQDHHQVIVVSSGTQLVEHALADRPEVVLTVLNLPGLSAQQAIEQIRAASNGAAMPIILLSRAEMPDVGSLGFSHWLKVPVERASLRRVLAEATVSISESRASLG